MHSNVLAKQQLCQGLDEEMKSVQIIFFEKQLLFSYDMEL